MMKTLLAAMLAFVTAAAPRDNSALKEAIAKTDSKAAASAAKSVAGDNNVAAAKALAEGIVMAGAIYQAELARYLNNRKMIHGLQAKTNTDLGQKGSAEFDKHLLESYRLSDRLLEAERCCLEIAKACSALSSDDAVKELIRRAKSGQNKPMGDYLAEALGYVKHADTVPALVGMLKTSQWRVKVAAIDALGMKSANKAEALSAIGPFLGDSDARIMRAAQKAQMALSGKADGKPGGALSSGGRGATFYEMPVLSDSVMFVCDASASMRSGGRIDKLKVELSNVIRDLPDKALVNIVTFNCLVKLMTTSMKPLNSGTRPAIQKYIDAIPTFYVTNTYETFQTIFRIIRGEIGAVSTGKETHVADTIFFMTDGKPTVPSRLRKPENAKYMTPSNIVECVTFWNRRSRVVINTIGIGEGKGAFLEDLAKANDGKFRGADGGGGGGGGKNKDKKKKKKDQNMVKHVGRP